MVRYDKANLLDLLSLERLERSCFAGEAFSRRLIKNLLVNPRAVVFKATAPGGEVVGNIIGVLKKERGSLTGRIFSLCVLESYRKGGVAAHLLRLLEEEWRLLNVGQFRLEVGVLNTVAQRFYIRHGYLQTPVILPGFYRNGTDALIMLKRLS
ncbi:MAG: GNAT family N-acetyltransferase [Planctomycetota bacterium]